MYSTLVKVGTESTAPSATPSAAFVIKQEIHSGVLSHPPRRSRLLPRVGLAVGRAASVALPRPLRIGRGVGRDAVDSVATLMLLCKLLYISKQCCVIITIMHITPKTFQLLQETCRNMKDFHETLSRKRKTS